METTPAVGEKIYWRIAFLLPLVAPLVLLGIVETRKAAGVTGPPASVVEVFLLGSLFYGGAPYLVFVVGLLALLWSKPVAWYRRATWVAPPAFLVLFVVGLQVYWIATSAGSWLESPRALSGFSTMVLVVGYAYVAIAWLVRWFLGLAGLLQAAPPHPRR
jgi:hypothetical protein